MPKRSGPIYRTPHEKFLRDVDREAERQSAHLLKVRFTGGERPHYRAVCSCGWVGEKHLDRSPADDDGHKHVGDWLA